MEKEIAQKLIVFQANLNAPKGQTNTFGGFNYRSAEDILKALKPLIMENNAVITLSDEIVECAGHSYIKATATITDCETGKSFSTSAFARESYDKKGMDPSQMTGATSSYARKYALNALLAIDDNKDADTNEFRYVTDAKKKEAEEEEAKRNEEIAKGLIEQVKKVKTVEELTAIWKENKKYQKIDSFRNSVALANREFQKKEAETANNNDSKEDAA